MGIECTYVQKGLLMYTFMTHEYYWTYTWCKYNPYSSFTFFYHEEFKIAVNINISATIANESTKYEDMRTSVSHLWRHQTKSIQLKSFFLKGWYLLKVQNFAADGNKKPTVNYFMLFTFACSAIFCFIKPWSMTSF